MTARSLRHGGWRDPARFALVVLIVGGVNATALVMVGLGPVLWLLYSRLTEPGVTWGRVAAATARIGVLTGLTSLWWVAGLWVQGGYGIPILRYTETYKTVADASLSQEALRGLGYWFFYGRDKLGPWIEPGEAYTTNMWLLVVSFAIPILALAAAAAVRWRHRAFFLVLVALGGLIGVGAHPWDGSSPAGAAFRAFTGTDAGLALRSTPRALPAAGPGHGGVRRDGDLGGRLGVCPLVSRPYPHRLRPRSVDRRWPGSCPVWRWDCSSC